MGQTAQLLDFVTGQRRGDRHAQRVVDRVLDGVAHHVLVEVVEGEDLPHHRRFERGELGHVLQHLRGFV